MIYDLHKLACSAIGAEDGVKAEHTNEILWINTTKELICEISSTYGITHDKLTDILNGKNFKLLGVPEIDTDYINISDDFRKYCNKIFWNHYNPKKFYPNTILTVDHINNIAHYQLNELLSVDLLMSTKGSIIGCRVMFDNIVIGINVLKYMDTGSIDGIFQCLSKKSINIYSDLKHDLFQITSLFKNNTAIQKFLHKNDLENSIVEQIKVVKKNFKDIKILFK